MNASSSRIGRYLVTSESVTEGHPDKVCDQISDAILDAILSQDPYARVACDCALTTGTVLVMGEITTTATVDIPEIARQTILDIGYDSDDSGLNGETCGILVSIKKQSADIARGVDAEATPDTDERPGADSDATIGAGDQGMMVGYACRETPTLMPLPIALAHAICRHLAETRRTGTLPYLRPDGKSQVTIEYEGREPIRVDTVIVSTQHAPDVTYDRLRQEIIRDVIGSTVPAELLDDKTRYLVNPTGRFVIGGPMADSGLTGRKTIVDTYGAVAHHGGGCFSGKDPTKVDRSASYMMRYVAKNLVAAGLAERAEVQVSYAIGVAAPISVTVDTFGTGKLPDAQIARLVEAEFDLRPGAIIQSLDLRRPIYRATAAYGHFGRDDIDAPWERVDRAAALRQRAERLSR